jgi:branched-chain amino acid aminotransferase
LPGITRKSILELLRDKGYQVEERLISIDEVLAALKDGTMEEFWGCGTAAVVSPVGALYYEGTEYIINDSKIGPITQMLYDTLTGIQWGKIEDPYNWVYKL